MADSGKNQQSDFMVEKIKSRPVNKKKLLKKTGMTAFMAVIFGAIACVTFLVLEPFIERMITPEEETPEPIVFPEVDVVDEIEEINPEDMLVQDVVEEPSETEEVIETTVVLEDAEIDRILDSVTLDLDSYKEFYAAIDAYAESLETSMVVVTGTSSDVDWMNTTFSSKGVTSGIILAHTARDYIILTKRDTVNNAAEIQVTFCNGATVSAEKLQTDERLNLAVISVPAENVNEITADVISVAVLGSSNLKDYTGIPVVALGSPMGTVNSVAYGVISADPFVISKTDGNYKLLTTDMYGSSNSFGILFNMQGSVMGIITSERADSSMKNVLTAVGISEIRKLVENMSNGKDQAGMGVRGVDVTAEANVYYKVPFGAYVTDVKMSSPAMYAGIQAGDIITALDEIAISSFAGYTSTMQKMEVGQTVTVTLQRFVKDEYKELQIEVTLASVN